jgi:DNA modification methylase
MLMHGNARHIPLADASVQTCVTSPPYWGLRDYGLATWEGGDAECDHIQRVARHDGGRVQVDGFHGSAAKDSDKGGIAYRGTCGKCGAVQRDVGIGLERTPDEYVANIVAVSREVKRVLRPDGTLWLNLGDSFASAWACKRRSIVGQGSPDESIERGRMAPGLKEKDLVGIPWRVAFALQADGWYLRSDIIWHKPNPMPESVTDRPTKAHEYLFLLAKAQRYYYDAEAIKEAAGGWNGSKFDDARDLEIRPTTGRKPSESKVRGEFNGKTNAMPGHEAFRAVTETRNRRDVWTIPTQPYRGAHFATFPEKLVEPCILAGTSPKACGVCGAPWERVTERAGKRRGQSGDKGNGRELQGLRTSARMGHGAGWRNEPPPTSTSLGWRPSCDHNDDTGLCIVLDPFCGSGTTGAVAVRLGRRFVGLDMQPKYLELARNRITAAPVPLMPEGL